MPRDLRGVSPAQDCVSRHAPCGILGFSVGINGLDGTHSGAQPDNFVDDPAPDGQNYVLSECRSDLQSGGAQVIGGNVLS